MIKGTGPKEYKMCFMRALINGCDIPKIYLYKVNTSSQGSQILDGGHRTRAIYEFMQGEYGIKLNDGNYYWWDLNGNEPKPRGSANSQNLILPSQLKQHMNNITLDIVTYSGISEKKARTIFNELNHHRPMTPAEVINSWNSSLVDKLRSLSTSLYQNSTYVEMLKDTMKVTETTMHEYLRTYTALFSLFERGSPDKFDYCEPKNTLKYIMSDGSEEGDAPDTQYDVDELEPLWSNFIDSCDRFFEFIRLVKVEGDIDEKWCPLTSEAYSYFHFINKDLRDVDLSDIVPILRNFICECNDYKIAEGRCSKVLKNAHKKGREEVDTARDNLELLNSSVEDDVIKWTTTFKNNGGGRKNMENRYEILYGVLVDLFD
jgi:hypothetical protein